MSLNRNATVTWIVEELLKDDLYVLWATATYGEKRTLYGARAKAMERWWKLQSKRQIDNLRRRNMKRKKPKKPKKWGRSRGLMPPITPETFKSLNKRFDV